ncbi:MAG: MerR family transcriptional regulator [Cytophagales bacterium]|nr:MerR family transcriptional regulator [Cytophagales bacterium]
MPITLDKYFGAANLLKALELSEYIAQEGLFDVKNTGVTYKTVNHWDGQGLLVSRRTGESKWRKFSFVDFIWLKMIEQFRGIGISIPLLRKVKAEIFQEIKSEDIYKLFKKNKGLVDKLPEGEQKDQLKAFLDSSELPSKTFLGIPVLQLLICETIFDRIPVSLIVFTDGNWFPWYEDRPAIYSEEEQHSMTYHTHVTVSVTEIIKEFLSSDKSAFILSKLHILSPTETKLLEIVHSGEYESITIHFKGQKVTSLEMVKAQHVKRKIVDILSENDYQEIVIKSHQGMVSTIKNTVKMKIS